MTRTRLQAHLLQGLAAEEAREGIEGCDGGGGQCLSGAGVHPGAAVPPPGDAAAAHSRAAPGGGVKPRGKTSSSCVPMHRVVWPGRQYKEEGGERQVVRGAIQAPAR